MPTDHHERTLCVGSVPPPILAPLFGPPGCVVDNAQAVVIVAVATMSAIVMIFRISSSTSEMNQSAPPDVRQTN
jgi:hypothetical protein